MAQNVYSDYTLLLVYMTSSDFNLDLVHRASPMLDYYLRRVSRKSKDRQGGPES